MRHFVNRYSFLVLALIFRTLLERTRQSPLGVMGLFTEPVLTTLFFVLAQRFFKLSISINMDLTLFFGVAFVLFAMFKRIIFSALPPLKRRQLALLRLSPVRPIDLIIVSGLSEAVIHLLLMMTFILVNSICTSSYHAEQIGFLFLVFACITIFTIATSLVLFQAATLIPQLSTVLRILVPRIFFWTSALFYSTYFLPSTIKRTLLVNPFLHGIELFRHYSSPSYSINSISLSYLTFASLLVTAAALYFYTLYEPKILKRIYFSR